MTVNPGGSQEGIDELLGLLQGTGYVPGEEVPSYGVPMPMNPRDGERFPAPEVGIPSDWDYRTAQFGPDGSSLPERAVGWTPDGLPYYGTSWAFTEWSAGMDARMNAPIGEDLPSIAERFQMLFSDELVEKFEGGAEGDILGGTGEVLLGSLQIIGDALANVGGGVDPEDPGIGAGVARFGGGAIRTGSRFVGGLLAGVGAAAQDLADITEAGIFGTRQTLREQAEQSDLPGFTPLFSPDEIGEIRVGGAADPEDGFAKQATNWFLGMAQDLNPIGIVWDIVRAIDAPISAEDRIDSLEANLAAGRIAYSSWIDEGIREEFIRKWRAGGDAYLLTKELQNPVAELAGELIFDPLNLLGAELSRAGKLRADQRALRLNTITDQPLAESVAMLAQGGDNAIVSSNLADVVNNVQRYGVEVRAAQTALAAEDGLRSLTPAARVATAFREAANMFGWIASNPRLQLNGVVQVDKVLDVVNDLIHVFNGTSEVATRAFTRLASSGVPISPLFAERGARFASIMTDISNAVPTQFIVDLKAAENVSDLIDLMSPRMTAAAENLFPSLSRRLSAVDEIAELTAAGKAIPPELQRAADIGATLNIDTRFVQGVTALADSKVVKGVNQFFANIYMGMSPGYYIRNVINNTLTTFVDQGFGAFFDATGFTGTITGKGRQAFVARATDWTESVFGFVPGKMFEGIGGAGAAVNPALAGDSFLKRLGRWYLTAAQEAERGASARIMYTSFQDTFRRMMPKVVGDVAPLSNIGVPEGMVESLMQRSYGDVENTVQTIRDSLATGAVDSIESRLFLTDDMQRTLDNFDMGETVDRMTDAYATSATRDEMLAIFDEGVDGLRIRMEGTRNIVPGQSDDLAAQTQDFRVNENLPTTTAQLNNAQKTANQTSDTLYLGEAAYFKNKLPPELYNQILDDTPILRDWVEGLLTRDEQAEAIAFMETTLAQSRALDVLAKSGDEIDWAREYFRLGFEGTPPPGLDRNMLGDLLWNERYYPTSRQMWNGIREINSLNGELLAARVAEAFPEAMELSNIDRARDALTEARRWDNGIVEPTLNGELQQFLATSELRGNRDFVRSVASRNGIATKLGTANDPGALNPQLMNILRKNTADGLSKADFPNLTRYLEQFSVDDAMGALRTSLGDEFVGDELIDAFNAARAEQAAARVTSITDEFVQSLSAAEREIFDAGKVGEVTGEATRVPFENQEEVLEALGRTVDDVPLERASTPFSPGENLGDARMVEQQWNTGLEAEMNNIRRAADEAYGGTTALPLEEGFEEVLQTWADEAFERVEVMKLTAIDLAEAKRDFAILDYTQRGNFDTALGLVFPYQFWHSRTYINWMRRFGNNPALLSAYSKYRRKLEEIHAGQPEWWRYNVNTNELLGLNSENPLYFNLESTLNPLNALVGVDFDDPYKRTNWWTNFLSDLNMIGPSTWTPLSVLTAWGLRNAGEDEAAARWGGQLFPQSRVFEAIGSLTGQESILGISTQQPDPFTNLFADGIDPYVEDRATRALAQMSQDLEFPEEALIDAARTHDGPVWEEALSRAIAERAPGTVASFFFGTGFKPRTVNDLRTDEFYSNYFRLWNQRPNLSPEEFQSAMSGLYQEYPFGETILLSRGGDEQRNVGYAYNVLGRLPPGSRDLLELVGLDGDLINLFYETKGQFSGNEEYDIEAWSEGDRATFMNAINDLGAILATPSNATRQEWDAASTEWKGLIELQEALFGDDIRDQIDLFWEIRASEGDEAAFEFTDANPEVAQAMDFYDAAIAQNPESLLTTYYGGILQIADYWRGLMYTNAEQRFGSEIWDIQAAFFLTPQSERRQFRRDNPVLQEYWDFKAEWDEIIFARVDELGGRVGEALPVAFRDGVEVETVGQENFLEGLQQQMEERFVFQTIFAVGGAELVDAANSFIRFGTLSVDIRDALATVATRLNISFEDLADILENVELR